jgi:zinc transporter ZupT
LASLSGLAEPVGAFVAIVVLHGFDLHNNGDPNSASSIPMDIDSILSFVAGVMVTVACYELFPEARRHTQDGTGPFWLGIVAGAIIMLASDAVLDATY